MAGRIPSQFIDELLNRVDIVDLIDSRVPLKKGGRDYQACCPFHNEKTPSFTVSREKQFYHCFGCGAHGSAIGFLMEYDNMDFVEAVEELAQREGLEVPREASGFDGPDYRPLYATMEQAAQFYQLQLRQHPQAKSAVEYLQQRGMSGEIAATFGIGFAPPGWDNLIKQMGRDKQGLEQLRLTGMISEPDGKCYDRFRDRIMFPIRNYRGQVIAFGGRILGDGEPKYLNSPETSIFHKGRELYGLYEARKAVKKLERLLVVEGYMDVVALAQFGIPYVVATLGTATTPEHLQQLFRTTAEVVFCFDGDQAGRKAGWKALTTSLPMMQDGREIRFLFLPDGEDPDSMIRNEGVVPFAARIEQATPLSSFLFDHLTAQVEMETPAGRAKLAELAKPLLSQLPQGVFRGLMQKKLSSMVGVELPLQGGAERPQRRAARPRRGGRQTMTPLRLAISMLLQKPELALLPELPSGWRSLKSTGSILLAELLELIENQPTLTSVQLMERWRERDEYNHLCKLAAIELPIPAEGEGLEAEFRGALSRLEEQLKEDELEQLLTKAESEGLNASEKERLTTLLSGSREGK